MTVTMRVSLTVLIILAVVAVAVFRSGNVVFILSAGGIGVVLIAVIWVVDQLKPEFGGTAKRPANLDHATKKLIRTLKKKFNDDDLTEIGDSAQDIIIATVKAVNSGKMKNISQAVDELVTVPPPKMVLEKNKIVLGATLASYYLQAEEKGEDGDDTKTRIDNFIAGIDDHDL